MHILLQLLRYLIQLTCRIKAVGMSIPKTKSKADPEPIEEALCTLGNTTCTTDKSSSFELMVLKISAL